MQPQEAMVAVDPLFILVPFAFDEKYLFGCSVLIGDELAVAVAQVGRRCFLVCFEGDGWI